LVKLVLWQSLSAHLNEDNFGTKNRSNLGRFFDFFEKYDIIKIVFRKGVTKMKKHIEFFNKFGRRFANVADRENGLIEIDFYEIFTDRNGIQISKVIVQYLPKEDFVNIIDRGAIDVYEIGDVFEIMPPIPLFKGTAVSKMLRDLFSYSVQIQNSIHGDIKLSKSREEFLNSEIRKIFRSVAIIII
jgi:hypothetical protein